MEDRTVAHELVGLDAEHAVELEGGSDLKPTTTKLFLHDLIAAVTSSLKGLVPSMIKREAVTMAHRRGLIFTIKGKSVTPIDAGADAKKDKKPKEIKKWSVMRNYIKS
eukprot:4279593-Pyramimonas_sp.AAC.1